MKQIETIVIAELTGMAEKMYGSLVKGVVDLDNDLLVLDAEMHVDEEQFLLERGSRQSDLWGINLYPAKFGTDGFLEFDSMINIRPRQQNMTRSIANHEIREKIITLIEKKVKA